MTLEQADAMIALARKRELLLAVNLMQRYNPLFEAVKRLIESQILGELLHGYFENYASDENLPPDHWFWDRAKSGGIFIEHGVHFFDMFAGWLGPGRWWPRSEAFGRARCRPSKSTCIARCATARRSWSTSITAFTRPAGWTGRSCGWCSSAAM